MPDPRSLIVLLGLVGSGCLDGPALAARHAPPDVTVTPSGPEGSARVVRLEVRGLTDVPLDPGEVWLFTGELSDYHLRRIHRRDLPETLRSRQVPTSAWYDAAGTTVTVAPQVALELAGRYTLAAPGLGLLLTFDVAQQDPAPLLTRLWPPAGLAADSLVVLCADQAPSRPLSVALEPHQGFAEVEPGIGELASGELCVSVHLPPSDSAGPFSFAAETEGYAFDPTPLLRAPGAALANALCADDEVDLGPGCAQFDDDRAVLRNGEEAALWSVNSDAGSWLRVLPPGGRWLIRGLEPDSAQRWRGWALSVGGLETPFEATAHTLPARAHLVLNEVLFNALGPEPAAEWVELVNDGVGRAELAGLVLRDAGGAVQLPNESLEPGQFALLVRNDFVPAEGGDVPPSAEATLLRVHALGSGGLSNSGERLQLEDAAGRVLSRFPALASRRAGVALARSTPDALDDDPRAFGEHAAPGASPGAPNSLENAP